MAKTDRTKSLKFTIAGSTVGIVYETEAIGVYEMGNIPAAMRNELIIEGFRKLVTDTGNAAPDRKAQIRKNADNIMAGIRPSYSESGMTIAELKARIAELEAAAKK